MRRKSGISAIGRQQPVISDQRPGSGARAVESQKLKEKEKRDGNTEFTEDRTQRAQRTARGREKITQRRRERGGAQREEEPKTQAHTPCLGHPQVHFGSA
jgi:hypothetical protein